MSFTEKCPVCSGDVVEKEVEKILRGGDNTAIVRARADVCLHCGERLYAPQTIRRFEEIRRKLEADETAAFKALGKCFEVV
jgi:YgiT-type zinc finger domain-containing protein